MVTIALDGPSGSGKSSLAKALSKELGIIYLDTGAMYRALGLKCLREGVECTDEQRVYDILKDSKIDIEYADGSMSVLLDGQDVSMQIRQNEVSKAASDVSAIGEVRKKLVAIQQDIARGKSVVMDGRDIGTHVLPNAKYKFFITAAPEVRAKRRHLELMSKGANKGFDEVLAEMNQRDHNDSTRKNSPLEVAKDAVIIDTSDMTLDEVIAKITGMVKGEN